MMKSETIFPDYSKTSNFVIAQQMVEHGIVQSIEDVYQGLSPEQQAQKEVALNNPENGNSPGFGWAE